MKKQVITVLITLLVVAVAEVGVFFAFKDYFLGSKEETKTEEKEPEKDNEFDENTFNGTFVMTFTDKAPKDYLGNQPSFLTLNEDGTYHLNYNNCDKFYLVKGNYEIKDDILTLLNSKKKASSIGDEDIAFKIVSQTEMYINRDMKCTIGASDYQKGYGSFKKIY